jgi:hypothetical protein
MDDGHVFRREAGGPSLRLVEASVIPATGERRGARGMKIGLGGLLSGVDRTVG